MGPVPPLPPSTISPGKTPVPLDEPSPKKQSDPLIPSCCSEMVDVSQLANKSSLKVYWVGEQEHVGWAWVWGRRTVAMSSKDFMVLYI